CVDAVQEGVTGILVPVRNVAALAGALRRYLCDAELRRRHGQAGRQRVLRDFAQEPLWKAMYQEYARLLGDRGCPVPQRTAAVSPRESDILDKREVSACLST